MIMEQLYNYIIQWLYNSCAIYKVILVISIISISISISRFVYFHWYLKKGNTETAIY